MGKFDHFFNSFFFTGEEVLWLADVHPETLELQTVELSVSGHEGENLLLNTRRLHLKEFKII